MCPGRIAILGDSRKKGARGFCKGGRSGDIEALKVWRPKNHKLVLTNFSVGSPQLEYSAIVLDCFFSGTQGFCRLVDAPTRTLLRSRLGVTINPIRDPH